MSEWKIPEQWKPIKGFEGYYMISSCGRVMSMVFTNNVACKPRLREISINSNGNGYMVVHLQVGGVRVVRYVHDLVLSAFREARPEGHVVNHKDHNRGNNHIENLEWCTQRENVARSKHLMAHARSVCRNTNTGEKYIYKNACGSYRLNLNKQKIYKTYRTLDEAVTAREVLVGCQ